MVDNNLFVVNVCKLCPLCVVRADNDFNKCMYEVMKTQCNEDMARVWVTVFQKIEATRLSSINCALGQLHCNNI